MGWYRCLKCGYRDYIKWKIEGPGLEKMTINFKCDKCGTDIILIVEFPSKKNKKPKVEIKPKFTNYIG